MIEGLTELHLCQAKGNVLFSYELCHLTNYN
jgi:hypothetical protein